MIAVPPPEKSMPPRVGADAPRIRDAARGVSPAASSQPQRMRGRLQVGVGDAGDALGGSAVLPAAQHALRHLLDDESEAEVVAPVAVDVDVPAAQPLVAEPELLHDAQAGRVLGADADLHAVQAQPEEAVV